MNAIAPNKQCEVHELCIPTWALLSNTLLIIVSAFFLCSFPFTDYDYKIKMWRSYEEGENVMWRKYAKKHSPCLDRKHSIVLFEGMGKNTHGRNFQRNIYPVSLKIYMNFLPAFSRGWANPEKYSPCFPRNSYWLFRGDGQKGNSYQNRSFLIIIYYISYQIKL